MKRCRIFQKKDFTVETTYQTHHRKCLVRLVNQQWILTDVCFELFQTLFWRSVQREKKVLQVTAGKIIGNYWHLLQSDSNVSRWICDGIEKTTPAGKNVRPDVWNITETLSEELEGDGINNRRNYQSACMGRHSILRVGPPEGTRSLTKPQRKLKSGCDQTTRTKEGITVKPLFTRRRYAFYFADFSGTTKHFCKLFKAICRLAQEL